MHKNLIKQQEKFYGQSQKRGEKKVLRFRWKLVLGGIEVIYYEFALRIWEIKIADPIKPTKM